MGYCDASRRIKSLFQKWGKLKLKIEALVLRLAWIILYENMWSRIWRIIRFNHFLTSSKIKFAWALQSLHYITLHYMHIHIHIHIHMHYIRILIGYRPSILHHQKKGSRSFLFKNRIIRESSWIWKLVPKESHSRTF